MGVFYCYGSTKNALFKIQDGELTKIINLDATRKIKQWHMDRNGVIWIYFYTNNTDGSFKEAGLLKYDADVLTATILFTDFPDMYTRMQNDVATTGASSGYLPYIWFTRAGTFVCQQVNAYYSSTNSKYVPYPLVLYYEYTIASDNTVTRAVFGYVHSCDSLIYNGQSDLCIFDNCTRHMWTLSKSRYDDVSQTWDSTWHLYSISIQATNKTSLIKDFPLNSYLSDLPHAKMYFNKDHHIYIWAYEAETHLFSTYVMDISKSKLLKFDIYTGAITTLFSYELDVTALTVTCSDTHVGNDVTEVKLFTMDPVNNVCYIVCRSHHFLTVKDPEGTSGEAYPDAYDFETRSFVLIYKDDVFYKKVILDEQTQLGYIYNSSLSKESYFNKWGFTSGTSGTLQNITIDSDGNAFIGVSRSTAGWSVMGYMAHYAFCRVTPTGDITLHYTNNDTVGDSTTSIQWDPIFGSGAYRYNLIPSHSNPLTTKHVFEVTPNG